jgi:putative transposase
MIRTYKFRIYPSKAQVKTLEHTLDLCCELYNAGLQERRDAWKICKKSISLYDQINQLPEIKKVREDLKLVNGHALQEVLQRLDSAFEDFFRRVKAGEKSVGYPRFRSRSRYNSVTFRDNAFGVKKGKLRLSKIGMVKIKLHRPIEGKTKTCTITKSATGKWFACIAVECEFQPLPACKDAVGIDVGIKTFAYLSTDEAIDNPKFFRKEEKEIGKVSRKMSAAKKGSPERKKCRKIVARVHERIANKRRDFAHQESRKLVNQFGIIVFEKLNISGMLKNHRLAKSIADAAWNQLVNYANYKAENAGRKCVQVNPCNTSQTCSGCGVIVKKDLSVRIHNCSACGLSIDRDLNAAINILRLGLQSLGISLESLSLAS